ncbi:hypothetical protein SESBI_34811 [Sesbania bispinosa]|nr:hypothetical protein SESBI_34811 [Sesbania bispinosa]
MDSAASMDNNSSGSNSVINDDNNYMIPVATTSITFFADDGNQNHRSNMFDDNDVKTLGAPPWAVKAGTEKAEVRELGEHAIEKVDGEGDAGEVKLDDVGGGCCE